MGKTSKRAASPALMAVLLATLAAWITATPAVASTSVASAGSVLPGKTSAGTAAFTFTENSIGAFPNADGTLTVTIADSASASTVHFSGTPVVSAPGSLGATAALGSGGTSFTVSIVGSDTTNIEQITISGLRIAADAGAAGGAIGATLAGTLAGAVLSPTAIGTLQSFVAAGASTGVVVLVTSPCGFATSGGSSSNVTFSDVADSRAITAATAVTSGQQTLTIGAGAATHAVGTTITQTVAACAGSALGSPGTVGAGSLLQHLDFTTQPGGGGAGSAWAQQPVVAVRNASNVIAIGDNSTVVTLAIASNPAGGTLSCASGLSRTVVNGIASFFGCSINIGSASLYSLSATSNPAWTPATSSGFTISPVLQPVVLLDAIAPGVNRGTVGFGTASVVVPRGGYVTLLGSIGPNLPGVTVQVWTRTKTGDWRLLTSRVAAADGTVHLFARITTWTAYQFRYAGDALHSSAASHGRIATAR